MCCDYLVLYLWNFSVRMWRAALLLLVASLSVTLARPQFKPLSGEMVNYINKFNTTWKVSLLFCLSFYFYLSCVFGMKQFLLAKSLNHPLRLQAGHNFHNVDYSYIQRLCGTKLNGPKLPIM